MLAACVVEVPSPYGTFKVMIFASAAGGGADSECTVINRAPPDASSASASKSGMPRSCKCWKRASSPGSSRVLRRRLGGGRPSDVVGT